jgi:hypothetical protein
VEFGPDLDSNKREREGSFESRWVRERERDDFGMIFREKRA